MNKTGITKRDGMRKKVHLIRVLKETKELDVEQEKLHGGGMKGLAASQSNSYYKPTLYYMIDDKATISPEILNHCYIMS